MRDEWLGHGLTPRDEMQTSCCYALQDKAWVTDPDGNEWEVFTVLKDNLIEAKSDDAECCTPTFTTVEGKSEPVPVACC
jgi:hypothetical protein